ncbi:hypothetical protein CLV62_10625 [Dysgonomonas alginatilytica]|uniref:Uncharacterized protein n=1 Tax=Dysgonomonas alginatilytica TaxID=1605892 RepID=A0A2V3PQA2_9BACT|nr:fimbrial protein [Dysgonomonas alginatilytica]PXV65852.1 hypothetical protein CLV62_10625 [Dysgonomonas alginatilytica]
MKPKYIHKLILLTIAIFSLLSCSDDNPPIAAPVSLSIGADSKISNLRIMAFNVTDQNIKNNFYYSGDITTVTLNMHAGEYNFFFIANAPDESFNSLEAIRNQAGLNNIQIPSSGINSDNNIPMTLYVPNVTVLPDQEGVVVEGVYYSNWHVALEHLAVRFDLVLKSKRDLSTTFTGVEFHNLPDNVPITGNYSGTHTAQRIFTTTANPEYFADTVIAGYPWAKIVKRVILPPNKFTPADQEDRLVGFSVLTGDNLNPSCTFGMDEDNNDYTMTPNTNFIVNAIVNYPMEVNISIAEWGPENVNGNITNRTLNVASLTASITDRNRARIYFTSNQPSVSVDAIGYVGATGTTQFNVNNVFYDLLGPTAGNLNYNPATGLGYIDIYTSFYGTLVANTTYIHRIYLNAGGLRREITVTTVLPAIPPAWSTAPYVGTFHRWNQTGERIVYSNNVGDWTATVMQGDFILLSSGRSFDPKLGLDSPNIPNNAENYPVTDGTTTVSGINRIYFRVGLTGTLASATTAPRYGLIRVTTTSGTSYLYVRQGEAPGVINSTVKWSAFNLSDPLRGLGGADISNHNLFTPRAAVSSTTFADFPTQVGYMFQWNLYNGSTANANRVFHPLNPAGAITGYPTGIAASWNTNNDPCPAGYRHPTGAEFTTFAPDTGNSLWGFYSDGFFDRRLVKSSANVTGVNNYEFGTYGRVFFNAATNASVFLPVAGNRISGGGLQTTSSGNYVTSDIVGSNANILLFNSSTVTPNNGTYAKARAFSVRCIQQ